MKSLSRIFLLLSITLISCSSGAKLVKVENAPPSKCKTQNPELNGRYTGTCRKGLAEGQGRAEGTHKTYIGEFDHGQPDGKGKMITHRAGQKSTKTGYWYQGTYVGKKDVDPYDIKEKQTVGRVRVKHLNSYDDRIEVRVDPGNTNLTPVRIKDIRLQGNSGSQHNTTQFRGYKSVNFPFKGRVDFKAVNVQDNKVTQDGHVDFEINVPGSWLIEIDAM